MAEEEKTPRTTDGESLIQVSPEFADVVSKIASRRSAKSRQPDVEGHAMTVEEFSAEGTISPIICGVVYSD